MEIIKFLPVLIILACTLFISFSELSYYWGKPFSWDTVDIDIPMPKNVKPPKESD